MKNALIALALLVTLALASSTVFGLASEQDGVRDRFTRHGVQAGALIESFEESQGRSVRNMYRSDHDESGVLMLFEDSEGKRHHYKVNLNTGEIFEVGDPFSDSYLTLLVDNWGN